MHFLKSLGATGERHSLPPLISACFWVIRESLIPIDGMRYPGLKDRTHSVGLVSPLSSPHRYPCLIYSILSYSMTLTVNRVPTEFVATSTHTPSSKNLPLSNPTPRNYTPTSTAQTHRQPSTTTWTISCKRSGSPGPSSFWLLYFPMIVFPQITAK